MQGNPRVNTKRLEKVQKRKKLPEQINAEGEIKIGTEIGTVSENLTLTRGTGFFFFFFAQSRSSQLKHDLRHSPRPVKPHLPTLVSPH